MPSVVLIQTDRVHVKLQVACGITLMHAAVANHVKGLLADCGGEMSCGTCHVLIDPDHLSRLPKLTPNEDQLLDFTAIPRQPNSRLSCQVVITEQLDGMCATVASQL
jgi:2Fe-2S ferredoxin